MYKDGKGDLLSLHKNFLWGAFKPKKPQFKDLHGKTSTKFPVRTFRLFYACFHFAPLHHQNPLGLITGFCAEMFDLGLIATA